MIQYLVGNFATLALFGALFIYSGILMADLLKLPYLSALIFGALLLIAQYLAFPRILDRVFRDAVWQSGESSHTSLLKKLQESILKRPPRLGILDCAYPITCSYGSWRGQTSIVVSTGLIELLSREELDCMLQREIQHLESGDFIPLMLTGAFPFLTYSLSKFFISIAMHFRFLRGVRTMASLGIFLMYVRKIASFFIYFASRARERRLDEICRRTAENPSLYRICLEKIRIAEIHHCDMPWDLEQKALALNFLAPLDCWDSFIESFFRIRPGSPLAAVHMKPERHSAWSAYFELFSSHPLWRARLDGLQEEPVNGRPVQAASVEKGSDSLCAEKPHDRSVQPAEKRHYQTELAVYLSPLFSSLAAVLFILLFHGGLMGLPFLLGGMALLAVILFYYPLSFRSLTPLSALVARAPSKLHGSPVVFKGKVYCDERQSIMPLFLFFENDVMTIPLSMLSFFPLEIPVTGHEADEIYEVRGWIRKDPYLHIEIKSLRAKGKTIISSAVPACSYIAALGFIALGIFLLALQMKGGL